MLNLYFFSITISNLMENNEILTEQSLENSQISESETNQDEITFEDLGLDENTLKAIEKKGFKTPSPIQILAIPRLLTGDANLIARARTGTGKTAAFGLPLIQKINKTSKHVKALVLEPTRELAVQTCSELKSFSQNEKPTACVLYGGAPYSSQIRELKNNPDIVVGTPGRIQDHIQKGTLDLSKIEYFILDEGDEMLDMGFIEDIEAIFEKSNPQSRILLFSATMPEPILKIASKFMGDYEIIEEEGIIDEPLLIEQTYWFVKESEKINALIRLIDISDDFYGLVFTQTKNDADNVAKALDEKGYQVSALHGDIAQSQREKVLARFRNKKTKILVATDVAARGIDISGLSHVVNYSLPFDSATYVHRIGRTGRAGSQGKAVSFVTLSERRKLSFLLRAIKKASKGEITEETIPSADEVIAKKRERIFKKLKEELGLTSPLTIDLKQKEESLKNDNIFENTEENFFSTLEESRAVTNMTDSSAEEIVFSEPAIAEGKSLSNLKKASKEFEKMARELCMNDDAEDVLASVLTILYSKELDKDRYGKINQSKTQLKDSDQTRLFVQIGKRDGYNPRAVAEYFSNLLHIPGRLIDKIDISQNFTLLSLPKNHAKRALELSKSNSKVPHIHVDIKESFNFESKRSFSNKKKGFASFEKEAEFKKSRKESNSFSRKKNRSSFHAPTERRGNAGLYKKSKGKAEKF